MSHTSSAPAAGAAPNVAQSDLGAASSDVVFFEEVPLRETILRDDEIAPEVAAELRSG